MIRRPLHLFAAWTLCAAAAQAQAVDPETTPETPEPEAPAVEEPAEDAVDEEPAEELPAEMTEPQEAPEELELGAHQEPSRWYGAIAFGYADSGYSESDLSSDLAGAGFPLGGSTVDTDGADTGYKGYAGYMLGERWAIELGYTDLGVIESTINFAGPVPAGFTTAVSDVHEYAGEGITLAARHFIVDGEELDVSLKVGAFFWDAEVDIAISGSTPARIDESGTDLHYGLGLHYEMDRNWGLQLELENYDVDDTDLLFATFGLTYRIPK